MPHARLPKSIAALSLLSLPGCIFLTGYFSKPQCGDGLIDVDLQEVCDDGGEVAGDDCRADCLGFEVCGDGLLDTARGEQCDDGNLVDADGCTAQCQDEFCGDGTINDANNEACDDGDSDNTDDCLDTCAVASCGDGFVQIDVEACDDGNIVAGDNCRADCLGVEECGDGLLDIAAGEICDDGNVTNGDGCESSCALSPVLQVATNNEHVCALLGSGDVVCWGESDNARLGYPGNFSDIGDTEPASSQGFVQIGGSATQISVGLEFSCALLEAGDVVCWGTNFAGQLGSGDTANIFIGDFEDPLTNTLQFSDDVVQLSSGGLHSCVLLQNGNVQCWGFGFRGRLGYGNEVTIGDDEPANSGGVVDVGGVVTQISAGGEHTCALLEDQSVVCWGSGDGGRLGYGNELEVGDDETPASVGPVDVGEGVIQVEAGIADHTCVLLVSGNVKCWGNGVQGKLGYGNQDVIGNDEVPSTVGTLSLGGPVARINAGFFQNCAILESGEARCWGDNSFAQLGIGSVDGVNGAIGDDETPDEVPPIDFGGVGVAQIDAGFRTCAILETNEVKCWADGTEGVFGLGDINFLGDSEAVTDEPPIDLGPGTVTQIEAGGEVSCVQVGGGVRCWGNADDGQIGTKSRVRIGDDEPPSNLSDIDFGAPVVRFSAGDGHACAITDDGALHCFGRNIFGELGNGRLFTSVGELPTDDLTENILSGLPNTTALEISAGVDHTCAILNENGSIGVHCWGRNENFAQLGIGSLQNQDEISANTSVALNGTPIQIAAGNGHSCALLSDNTLRCWGEGTLGRLGYGNQINLGDNETLENLGPVPVGQPVNFVATGGAHTCAILDTGDLRCWGNNNSGQLGYGAGSPVNIGDDETPAAFNQNVNPNGTTVTRVAAGALHTCMLLDAGELRCWGFNTSGQLGLGDIANRSSPQIVPLEAAVSEVSAGTDHTCALLVNGAVRCWGRGSTGQLGLGTYSIMIGDDETPNERPGIPLF